MQILSPKQQMILFNRILLYRYLHYSRRKQASGQGDGSSVPESSNPQFSAQKNIPALNVDSALDAMSGLQDVYSDTVKLTVRLLPDRINNMDNSIDTDMKSFTHWKRLIARKLLV